MRDMAEKATREHEVKLAEKQRKMMGALSFHVATLCTGQLPRPEAPAVFCAAVCRECQLT